MKKSLAGALLFVVAAAGPLAAAETQREVTEKTTVKTETYSGTVSEVNPSTIILKSETSSTPTTYSFTEKTTFVDEAGNVVTRESVRNRPVTVYYTKDADGVIVSKVVVTRPTGGVMKRETIRKETEVESEQ